MPQTVLLIHNFYRERGGEDQHVEDLESLLRKRGHRVVTYYRSSKSILRFSLLQKLFLPFHMVYSNQTVREISQIIDREKPDIAHIHNIFPLISSSIFCVLKEKKVPAVLTLHNYRTMCLNGLFLLNNGTICERCQEGNFLSGISNRCYQRSFLKSFWMAVISWKIRFQNWLWNQIDGIICPSEFMASKVALAGIPKKKIFRIEHFTRETKNGSLIPNQGYALYMGRFSREKGIPSLLDAFSRLPQIKLKMVGGGDLEHWVKNFIRDKNLSSIECIGRVSWENAQEILKKASCLIFPSECYENMPLTVLESFCAGVPVIVNRLGGMVELVQDGYNGWLVEPKNSADLRTKIELAIKETDTRVRVGQNARRTWEERFSEQVAYQKLVDCYNVILNQKSKNIQTHSPNQIVQTLYKNYYLQDRALTSLTSSYWKECHEKIDIKVSDQEIKKLKGFGFGDLENRSILFQFSSWLTILSYLAWLDSRKELHQIIKAGKKVVKRMGLSFTYDCFRQICSLNLILRYLKTKNHLHVLIIGDGYGFLSALLKEMLPNSKITLVDLGKTLLFQAYYIQKAHPALSHQLILNQGASEIIKSESDFTYCPADFLLQSDLNVKFDLAINIASMQEMNQETIRFYFDYLRHHLSPENLFYCCNREEKELPGGERIQFANYPWSQKDMHLVDEACPWIRYFISFYRYEKGPRFRKVWYPLVSRFDGSVLHRLSCLDTV